MLMTAIVLGFSPLPASVQTPILAAPVTAETAASAEHLAVAPLLARRNRDAIRQLEQARRADPEDPAILINLGIAHAQLEQDNEARMLFAEALTKPALFDLATSGGHVTDSRRLARKALRMLDHGEFRASLKRADHVTLRD